MLVFEKRKASRAKLKRWATLLPGQSRQSQRRWNMGVGASCTCEIFEAHVRDEFQRCLASKTRSFLVCLPLLPRSSPCSPVRFLQTLEDLMQFAPSPYSGAQRPADFSHLGTLYVLNKSHSGRFDLPEMLAFTNLCWRKYERLDGKQDFKVRTHLRTLVC